MFILKYLQFLKILSGGPHVINSLLSFQFRPNWADTKIVGFTEISLLQLIHFSHLLYNQTKEMMSLPYFSLLFAPLLPLPNIALVFEFEFADLALSPVSCNLSLSATVCFWKLVLSVFFFFPTESVKTGKFKGKQQRNLITFKCPPHHPNVTLKYKLLLSSRQPHSYGVYSVRIFEINNP